MKEDIGDISFFKYVCFNTVEFGQFKIVAYKNRSYSKQNLIFKSKYACLKYSLHKIFKY